MTRFGGVIKETGTGKIVAHLQESGLVQHSLAQFGGFPFSPLSTVSSLAANYQIHQLTKLVQTLQVLQFANIGISIAGIGVSAVEFTIINKKLSGIQSQLENLESKIDQYHKEARENRYRDYFYKLSGLVKSAEEAEFYRNKEQRWLDVASNVEETVYFFQGELDRLLQQETFEQELFLSIYASFALCCALRVECLILANELAAAHAVANNIGHAYSDLFDDITGFEIARKAYANNADKNIIDSPEFRNCQELMNGMVQGLRDATDIAMTRPFLIENLVERGIEGRAFLTRLREEKENPLLFIPHE